MHKLLLASLLACAGLLPVAAQTPDAGRATQLSAEASASAAVGTPTEGEIRKVDPEARKITIRHGEIRNLDMPAMTMVFQVKDPAFLDRVKSGDKVRFLAERVNGSLTVTAIEVVQ